MLSCGVSQGFPRAPHAGRLSFQNNCTGRIVNKDENFLTFGGPQSRGCSTTFFRRAGSPGEQLPLTHRGRRFGFPPAQSRSRSLQSHSHRRALAIWIDLKTNRAIGSRTPRQIERWYLLYRQKSPWIESQPDVGDPPKGSLRAKERSIGSTRRLVIPAVTPRQAQNALRSYHGIKSFRS